MKKDFIQLEKERDFGDKVNATFSFVSQNFKLFALSLLYFAGPLALIGGIANGVVQTAALGIITQKPTQIPRGGSAEDIFANSFGQSFAHLFTLNYLVAVVFLVLATMTVSTTVYAFMLEYKESEDGITIDRVWGRFKKIFPSILGNYGLYFIGILGILAVFGGFIYLLHSTIGAGVGMGFALFFIGMILLLVLIYYGVIYTLSPCIVAHEGIGAVASFSRAKFLIKDKWWSTFGLIVIITVINYFIGMLFSFPALIIIFMKTLRLGGDFTGNTSVIMTTVLSTLGQILVSSLTYVGISFQYFNLVEKREGTALISQIESIGQKPVDLNLEGEY